MTDDETPATTEKTYVTQVTEFGNGAHVILPKDWTGKLARIEAVGAWVPPLFTGFDKGDTVFVETDDETQLNGDVIEYDISTDGDRIRAYFLLDTGRDFYRISIERDGMSDQWPSNYSLERAVDGDEAREEIDEVISLEPSENGGAMWAPVGSVTGIAAMERTTT